jgi:hypothetical protein
MCFNLLERFHTQAPGVPMSMNPSTMRALLGSAQILFLALHGCAASPEATTENSQLTSAIAVCKEAGSGRTIVVAKRDGDHTSIQAGLDAAEAGDTVLVRAGVYKEQVSITKSGSASKGCITLRGQAGAIIDGEGGGNIGISVEDQSYIAIIGLTVQGFRGDDVPTGIAVSGSAHHIDVRNNLVHHIENRQDAHGISFYGRKETPMSDLFIDGNEIRDCILGSSESMVLNGNVTRFVVSNNKVHDNDNIGIDFIGFEGQGPDGQDQVRDGICVDNIVYNIDSGNNPAYNGEHSAGGIYVDGGRDIVIERNKVSKSDIGIEVASEHGGRSTSNITVRNNFVSDSYQGNIMMGGYDAGRGSANNIVVVHNTLFHGGSGEIVIQNNTVGAKIKNNILHAKSDKEYVVSTGSGNSEVSLENNIYFGASQDSPGSFEDSKAKYKDPMLAEAPTDMRLRAGSPAIDSGIELGVDDNGVSVSGKLTIGGRARRIGRQVDIGADER